MLSDEWVLQRATDNYAVVGNPVEHSLSPRIHQIFARQTQQNMCYQKFFSPLDEFESRVRLFFNSGGQGLNITLPFKQRAFAMADHVTKRAQSAGAVNTLYCESGKLFGDNTDGAGLVYDMQSVLGWTLNKKKVLLLGAGGAARGVLLPLLEQGVSELSVWNRTRDKAQLLVDDFVQQGFPEVSVVVDFECAQTFDIVINATSASLSAQRLDLPEDIVCETSCCYDMAYAREPTVFMQWAADRGVQHISDGLGMLIGQAAEAFFVWRNIRPDTAHLAEQLNILEQSN